MAYANNRLLDSLAQPQRQKLVNGLQAVELKQHSVLFDVREAVDTIYFPFDAVVSLVVPLNNGSVIEAAMVGRDGVIGAAAATNGRVSVNRAVVQLGGRCLQGQAQHLKAVMDEDPAFRAQINAHEQVLFAQAQQSAACNVTHNVENRLARWLLRARD